MYDDIAKTLGTNAASVRASHSWALRKIRAVMFKDFADGGADGV